MNYEFKISKIMLLIIMFLFIFGISLQVSRSSYFLQLNIENEYLANSAVKHVSALSPDEKQGFEQEKMLIIFDPDSEEILPLKENLEKTLEYLKKPYETVAVSQIPEDLSAYENIIIAFSELEKADDFNAITHYVSEGGKLFFAVRPELSSVYYSLYQKMGINETGDEYNNTYGIEMTSDLLLKGEKLKIETKMLSNSSLSVQLAPSSKLFARSFKGVPLLWSTSYGDGTIMVFNGTMLMFMENRGLIAGALSYLNPNFIYPIMNSKVVYIDDFPAPFPEGNNEEIYKVYKRDIKTFFRDIWWPDMVQTAKQHDVKYTGVLIETYDNEIKGPFHDRLVKENLKIYGRELIKMGGEVGVHGYNHQSLTTDQDQVTDLGYHAWEKKQDMIESLKEVDKFFGEIFPDYKLRTYVPPSNILSEEGKQAVLEAIPSIRNIASLFQDNTESEAYSQEFAASDHLVEIPRLTSDYHFSEENKWMIASSATFLGAFSHFIHPDDILDEERSNSDNWEILIKEFDEMMHSVKENYPWMKAQTASESANSLLNYQNTEVFVSQKNDKKVEVYLNNFSGELDFILRSNKKITKIKGCSVEEIGKDRYLVHAKESKFVIELGESS